MLKMFLVTGGRTKNSDSGLVSTEIYDPDTGSWRAGAALPSPLQNQQAITIANRILIFGIDIYCKHKAIIGKNF